MEIHQTQPLKLFNSLSGKKELFVPITKGRVGIYVCGPTVYSNVHLGNCRTFVSFDIIYRYFKFLGYKVRYVRNITDAGHLEENLTNTQDKVAKKAILEKLEPMEVVQRYTLDFHKVMNTLNALPPSIEPTATGHIIEQIELIERLIDNDMAYERNGSVYFDLKKYNAIENYGELSNRNIDELFSQTRDLDGQEDKKNSQDFALWKKASSEHIMRWPSPWGEGFPGWHLECTVMSTKYLGCPFDIHGGGIDLKFPHHECELAQTKGAYQKEQSKYWMHTNMLTLNGQKMSKSLGNSLTPEELFTGNSSLLSKKYNPKVVRFFMLQAHYRSTLDFSDEALLAAERGFTRLMNSFNMLFDLKHSPLTKNIDIKSWIQDCYDAMNDDFNTPILISHLFSATKIIHQLYKEEVSISEQDLKLFQNNFQWFMADVLGLGLEIDNKMSYLSLTMELLIELRNRAREEKNWELSDYIRNKLLKSGIELLDGKQETTYQLK